MVLLQHSQTTTLVLFLTAKRFVCMEKSVLQKHNEVYNPSVSIIVKQILGVPVCKCRWAIFNLLLHNS